ncbi:MAG: hypothetical protein ACREP5_12620, partial [Candidatus Binatia bacterium]
FTQGRGKLNLLDTFCENMIFLIERKLDIRLSKGQFHGVEQIRKRVDDPRWVWHACGGDVAALLVAGGFFRSGES